MKALRTLKEVLLSSLPLAAIFVIVCVFFAPLENPSDYGKLVLGFFLVGLDESILPEVNATLFIWILSTGIGVFVGLALYRVVGINTDALSALEEK